MIILTKNDYDLGNVINFAAGPLDGSSILFTKKLNPSPRACGLTEDRVTEQSRVCAFHFVPGDYIPNTHKHRKGVLPTVNLPGSAGGVQWNAAAAFDGKAPPPPVGANAADDADEDDDGRDDWDDIVPEMIDPDLADTGNAGTPKAPQALSLIHI